MFQWGRIPQMVDRAFREANSGIPGPVHVDIPVDVLFGRGLLNTRRERRMLVAPGRTRYDGPVRGPAGAIASAAAAMGEASKPVAIVGQGFGRNGRYRETMGVLVEPGIPVATTATTPGFSHGDGCYAGDVAALGGSQSWLDMLAAADLLLLVGADRHAIDVLAVFDGGTSNAVVQVEVDLRAFLTGQENHCPVYADPLSALAAIKERLAGGYAGKIAGWNDGFVSTGKQAAVDACGAHPAAIDVFELLAGVSDENFILVADGPESKIAAARLLTGASYGDLFIMDETDIPGAALPFALGAAIANPEDRVVHITDKDSLFYHVRELQPAACGPIPLTLICIDDTSAANVAGTESVLEGLGCEVRKFDPAAAREDLLAPRPLAPLAFIVKPA